jgi:glycine cleavage system H protein
MNVPENLLYTKEHEWALVEDDVVTFGITDYAQGELGDIVFVEFPTIGDHTEQMKPCASIEAVKTVSDLYAPVSGEVIEINSSLESDPQLVNKDPYGDGWMIKVKLADKSELDRLMSPDGYKKLIG